MRDKYLFLVEYKPQEFIFVNKKYISIFKFDDRVVMHFPQRAKVHTLGFGYREFKTVVCCLFIHFVEVLLK